MTAEKIREDRLRRRAQRRGYRLENSRCRDPDARDFGGYMLMDADTQHNNLRRPQPRLLGRP